jgi:two-component system sensor histidine kinase PhoQ
MNRTVEYQLQRAAASGRIALAAPVLVEPIARKLVYSLAKVYAEKSLRFDIDVDAELSFHGDDGDLMEVLGNLADNACKWARRRVAVRAFLAAAALPDSELVLEIEDDGPGIPVGKRHAIVTRGARADPDTSGHGIGLAVVSNIVEEVYRGSLEIEDAPRGGTRVRARLRR